MAETVFVGLSGGVDSSVAAARLLALGYNVVGVFIKVWHPDWLVCNWEQERLDAMRVAAHLNIPFLTCDATDAYRDEVAQYFIDSYKCGRTPNPDVMCNKAVKFGAFLEFANKRGADYIATGHYARVSSDQDGFKLWRGVDTSKDQSYFLWTLTQEQLSRTLLPVGSSEKRIIREEAARLEIPTALKKDSQGVCFLGHIDIPQFLSHYIELKAGLVLNTNREVIGEHQGAFVYTLGQRHGFTISSKDTVRDPYYIVGKDVENNILIVDKESPTKPAGSSIRLTNHNWIPAEVEGKMEAQFRYRQKPFIVDVKFTGGAYQIEILDNTEEPASGQSCVLYRGDQCLGGGMIV